MLAGMWPLETGRPLLLRLEQEKGKKGVQEQISQGLSRKGDGDGGGDFFFFNSIPSKWRN